MYDENNEQNRLTLKYNRSSAENQKKSDRIQLLFASFAFFITYAETINEYGGVLMLIPIAAFILSVGNIVVIAAYSRLEKKFGHHLEATIFRINGIMMLITALSFEFIGNHRVQYAYYLLFIIYFAVMPYLSRKMRAKLKISFFPEMIVATRSFLKPKEYLWQDIQTITQKDALLKIAVKNKRKAGKYFLNFSTDEQKSRLAELFQQKKKEYGFLME